ncbi:MAG: folate-binding protein [Gallionellaceae bacterium]|nr:folate-binding protein [Gallionellaceae bacterium]
MHNANWQSLLQTQGAQFSEGIVQSFGSAPTEQQAMIEGTAVCDLSQFGVLKVTGEEAQSFLQNLCSNDVAAITPALAQLSSLNTAKGRVLATFLIWKIGNDYYLHLPSSLIAAIQKKLTMYVLRAKVKIENISEKTVCLGIAGKDASTLLKTQFGDLPTSYLASTFHDGTIILRFEENRYLLCTIEEQASMIWQRLSAEATPVGSGYWDYLNIRAGVPVILPATQEQFVLQMINLELIGGVSFKKGCYPGQEIVARMHYLGKPKQRTYLAHIASDTAPQANDPLFSADYEGQVSGNIVNTAPAAQGGYDVLASLHVSTMKANLEVHWNTADGVELRFEKLPYDFPAESAA